jgi:D-tyrosyl-tRNA(Tyr) deacylase
MRAVVQRVAEASVTVDGRPVGEIGPGLAVLVGVAEGDGEADAVSLADKIVGLRVFQDSERKMNRSVVEIGGAVLVVSQFTLLGDVRKGRRPSFIRAADPDVADELVQALADRVAGHGVPVATGEFGASMQVSLVNDGPVTILIETADGRIR